jgi:c-di-GMP-binding flagellar brake protein YcgR
LEYNAAHYFQRQLENRIKMPESKIDRRKRQRFSLRLPVSVKTDDGVIQESTQTRDLSTGGVFVYTNSRMQAGSDLELVLVLPPEITFADKRWVCCQASVVRVEENERDGNFGVAAVIKRFDVLPEI